MDVPGRSLDAAPTDIVPAEVAHGGDASRHATTCYLRVAGGRPRGGDAHKRYAGSCMYGSTINVHQCPSVSIADASLVETIFQLFQIHVN